MKRRVYGVLGMWLIGSTLACQASELKIGVRYDASPFAFKKEGSQGRANRPLDQFDGYSVFICNAVLDEMYREDRDLTVVVVEVNALDRFDKLDRGDVDILCGADTITAERIHNFAFSIPIYLSGIALGYNVSESSQAFQGNGDCTPVVGMASRTTAASQGLRTMLENGEFGLAGAKIEAAQKSDSTSCGEGSLIRHFKDHISGIDELCKGDIPYYIADREILEFSRSRSGCKFDISFNTYSIERYGIVFRRPNGAAGGRAKSEDAEIYFRFNYHLNNLARGDDSILLRGFRHAFRGYQMSEQLVAFMVAQAGASRSAIAAR